jgi:predicted acyl esterase
MIIECDIMVAARDGAALATAVYRPDGAGPFPAILERMPYDKSAPSRSEITASGLPRSISTAAVSPTPIAAASGMAARST